MSLRLETEKISYNVLVGEGSAQTVVEGAVTLPDQAPPVGKALLVRAEPRVTSVDVVEDRVVLEGQIDIDLFYAAYVETEVRSEEEDALPEVVMEEKLEKSTFPGALSFAFVLDVPGAQDGLPADVRAVVESAAGEVGGDQRTIDIDVVLALSAAVTRWEEFTCTGGVVSNREIEIASQAVRVETLAVSGTAQVKSEGFLPFAGKTLPDQVLDISLFQAGQPAVKTGAGKAEVAGTLHCSVIYMAEDTGLTQGFWEDGLSYRLELDIPGLTVQSRMDVAVVARNVNWRVVENEEQRGLAVTAELQAAYRASEAKEVVIVTGISLEGTVTVDTRRQLLTLQEAVGEGRTTGVGEALLELPSGLPPIERILCGRAAVQLEDAHVLGDKVVVEAKAGYDIIYIGRNGENTSLVTASWPGSIPLELEIAIPGAEPGLDRQVHLRVEQVEVDLINREMLEVKVEVAATATLRKNIELEAVIEAVEVPPPDGRQASYTFVVIRDDDSLWKLSRRYHVEINDIIRANRWLESEETPLVEGMKLCVPKGRKS
ncbi:MAG TPA: DUF3794 domain-containing protein [Firmicutes bacterium]|nr:DUF3794 domain-containing protein [Bacillota bacterium]